MKGSSRYSTGALVLVGLTALVLALAASTLNAPARDLAYLAGFLLASGGFSIFLAIAAPSWAPVRRLNTLRTRLIVVSVLTATLALSTVVLTSSLMFISSHDLALLAGLILFAFGISVFVALATSGPMLDDIDQLTYGVRKLSEGDLDTVVPVRTGDEVGQLGAAFNSMTRRLKESTSKQESLEQARRELIAAVSHDLRTPLASIRAMVESLSDGVVTEPEAVNRYLKRTVTEIESLGQLINDLFELSQLDSGLLELHLEEASLDDVISDILESMSAQAKAKHVRLDGSVDGGPIQVMMDTRRVQRVLANLVQNSIRHTPDDGSISISASDAGANIRVAVTDSGEGIEASDLGRLFDRSYRGDASRARSSGGAGLGLTIAKGIVEAHGGSIRVDSKIGVGSTFEFTLPKQAARESELVDSLSG
ncbi:MAG: ATP-binding protein [Chloroflexi bacterium]|nr:ATP-binding protein [Chloroflexota bacterium]